MKTLLRVAIHVSVIVGLAALPTSAVAQTATVTLRTLDHGTEPGGRFLLTASVSPGHSFGIASYSVALLGDFTFDHRSPGIDQANGSSGLNPAGFTLFRTPDQPMPRGGATISASQDTVVPTPYLYYGVGQSTIRMVDGSTNGPLAISTLGDDTQDDALLTELIIGEGNYENAAPTINRFAVDNGVQVFTSNTDTNTTAATLVLDEVAGPPASVEARVHIVAAISFQTESDQLFEVIATDSEGNEVLIETVAGDGSMARIADLQAVPLDTSLRYAVRTDNVSIPIEVKPAAGLSFETMAGGMYEVVAIDADRNETIVGRTAGDGSISRVADLDNLPVEASIRYRVDRVN